MIFFYDDFLVAHFNKGDLFVFVKSIAYYYSLIDLSVNYYFYDLSVYYGCNSSSFISLIVSFYILFLFLFYIFYVVGGKSLGNLNDWDIY